MILIQFADCLTPVLPGAPLSGVARFISNPAFGGWAAVEIVLDGTPSLPPLCLTGQDMGTRGRLFDALAAVIAADYAPQLARAA